MACDDARLRELDFGKEVEERIMAFEMSGLRRILRVSRAAKKTSEWVTQKARVTRALLQAAKKENYRFWIKQYEQYGPKVELDLENLVPKYILGQTDPLTKKIQNSATKRFDFC